MFFQEKEGQNKNVAFFLFDVYKHAGRQSAKHLSAFSSLLKSECCTLIFFNLVNWSLVSWIKRLFIGFGICHISTICTLWQDLQRLSEGTLLLREAKRNSSVSLIKVVRFWISISRNAFIHIWYFVTWTTWY